ncbi:MFS transporter [Phaeacidiphilus oryzae]|uniref:MFS transporter n=1 Tax=Phaeacidiphilus oryzae TaxID=348818 RepID=UPI00055CE5E1|nr:MFS transporter [Phaeacidiphilus oryzae]
MSSAQQPAGRPKRSAEESRRWRALGVCLTAAFMTLLDTSIVNVALPSIERGLHASQADLSWVLSGYALTFGLALVPAGRLGDLRGRRNSFLIGMALFTVFSMGCGLAPGSAWLVVFRLAQGAAAGLVSPQVSGLIQQMFSGAERARAFGMMGSIIGISTAIGPLVGGLLIQAFGEADGWRWVFFVNLPIGLGCLAAAWRLLPRRDPQAGRRQSFDPVGVLLLGLGVVTVMLPLVQEQQWHGAAKWLLLPAGALLLGGFWWWEGRQDRVGRSPLFQLSLFRMRSYALGALLAMVYFAGFTPLFFVYTLFLQTGLGYSAFQAGLASLPFALGSAVSARLGGRLVVRYGRKVVVLGLGWVAVGLAGTVLAVHLTPGQSAAWAAAVPLLAAGFGSGLSIAPNTTLTLAAVPVRLAGAAGGMLQTAQRIGSAAGIALVGAVYFAHLASSHSWPGALQLGLLTALGLVLLAIVAAVADLGTDRGDQPVGGNRSEAGG